MKSLKLLDLLENDDSTNLDAWLMAGGDPNSKIHRKSLLEFAIEKNAKNCSYVLCLHGAHSAKSNNPTLIKMMKETVESRKLMRDLPLSVLSIIDSLSHAFIGNEFLNEPRDMISKDVNGAKVMYVGLHHFEHRNRDFRDQVLKEVFGTSHRQGKYACVVSMISKRHLLDQARFQERITGFLIFREVPAEKYGQVTMGIKMIEQETIVGIYFSDEPVLNWREDEKHYDVNLPVSKTAEEYIKKNKRPKSLKRKHKFKEITKWSSELNRWSQRFNEKHGVYPTVLLASGDTFNRIDLVANTNSQENIRNDKGFTPREFVKMTGFNGPGYSLEFCLDDRLELDEVVLIYPVN